LRFRGGDLLNSFSNPFEPIGTMGPVKTRGRKSILPSLKMSKGEVKPRSIPFAGEMSETSHDDLDSPSDSLRSRGRANSSVDRERSQQGDSQNSSDSNDMLQLSDDLMSCPANLSPSITRRSSLEVVSAIDRHASSEPIPAVIFMMDGSYHPFVLPVDTTAGDIISRMFVSADIVNDRDAYSLSIVVPKGSRVDFESLKAGEVLEVF
jgi:hypothetical protein